MEYETIIGLEVHSQLLTESKMFCSCGSQYQGVEPNTLVCAVCMGLPGTLPVINKKAVEYTIMTGLALKCEIAKTSKFDRKNYPYPDLMKGYQISQYDMPLCEKGYLEIDINDTRKRLGVTRVHLEEDVAKLFHRAEASGKRYSLLDVNRSGVALMEIVSEPDMRSAEEARQYLLKLRTLLQYLRVSTARMEEGSFRCDANISIRPVGYKELMPKVEIKNMNSIKAVFQGLEHEVSRQKILVEKGQRVAQETRGWIEEKGVTFSQRSKENANDYRYFPEPDLPPISISNNWVKEISNNLPELPEPRRDRLMTDYKLPLYDANLLTSSRSTADFFEEVASLAPKEQQAEAWNKSVSNWILSEGARLLNIANIDIDQQQNLTPQHLANLITLTDQGALNSSSAKVVFEEIFQTGKSPNEIIQEKGLTQISDDTVIEKAADEAISNNPQALGDYLNGKDTAVRFLMGQVMKITKGKANPSVVNSVLESKLQSLKQQERS